MYKYLASYEVCLFYTLIEYIFALVNIYGHVYLHNLLTLLLQYRNLNINLEKCSLRKVAAM